MNPHVPHPPNPFFATLLFSLIATFAPIASAQTKIWFGDNNTGIAAGVTPDFLSKFDTPSSWSTSNGNMETYMFARPSLSRLQLDDSWYTNTLKPQLDSGNTKFGLNVTGATWLSILSNPGMTGEMTFLNKMRRSGIDVDTISLQSVLSKPTRNGEEYTMAQRIQDAVTYAVAARQIFPDAKVGIIDALYAHGDDYVAPYLQLKSELALNGIQLDHIIVDLPYHYLRDGINGVSWIGVKQMENYVQDSLGLNARFGLILTHATNGGNNSNDEYHQGVMSMLDGMFNASVEPDFVNIMAWFPNPTHSLPEDPNSTNLGHLGTLNQVAELINSVPELGDCNQDGVVDFLDISPFISILSAEDYFVEADVNEDGNVDFLDISPFIAILSGS